ncbi:hypothetical protein QL285_044544 [Trifolium repens]|nr:hypothetical protein QL285_044544 [Trifolium repens]
MCTVQLTIAQAAHSHRNSDFTIRFRCNRLNINGGISRREIAKPIVMAILVLSLIEVQGVTQWIVLVLGVCHSSGGSMVIELPNEGFPSWTGDYF